jgi:hypothetical protein
MVAPRGASIMVAPRIKGELTMGILIIKRVLAVAAMFGTAALANVDGGGGEGTFAPKVDGASLDHGPNAPLPAPMPPGACKFG